MIKNGIAKAGFNCDMTDPFVERDKKAEEKPATPIDPSKKTDELAVDLAEEWNAPPEAAGESGAS